MDKLLINPSTKQSLQALLKRPSHAIGLVGDTGMGKLTLAQTWAHRVTKPHMVTLVQPETNVISIESIRELYKITKNKQEDHQIIIIDKADTMTRDAQNALLKLLEEPRPGTTFILNISKPDILLPTIKSRIQPILVHRLNEAEITNHIKLTNHNLADAQVKQISFIASGKPGLATTIASDPDKLAEYSKIFTNAKQLLGSDRYKRLVVGLQIASDRELAIATLEAMQAIVKAQVKGATSKPTWLKINDRLDECLQRLSSNCNVKIQLANLLVSY